MAFVLRRVVFVLCFCNFYFLLCFVFVLKMRMVFDFDVGLVLSMLKLRFIYLSTYLHFYLRVLPNTVEKLVTLNKIY